MIGGLGAIQLTPSVGGSDAATGLLQPSAPATGGVAPATGGVTPASFTEALERAATKTVDTMQNAEAVSIKALQGDADTRQVADAVMSAQQALQTAVAIRDKVVSAYLEVSRMGI